jgi:hypothetical protein
MKRRRKKLNLLPTKNDVNRRLDFVMLDDEYDDIETFERFSQRRSS